MIRLAFCHHPEKADKIHRSLFATAGCAIRGEIANYGMQNLEKGFLQQFDFPFPPSFEPAMRVDYLGRGLSGIKPNQNLTQFHYSNMLTNGGQQEEKKREKLTVSGRLLPRGSSLLHDRERKTTRSLFLCIAFDARLTHPLVACSWQIPKRTNPTCCAPYTVRVRAAKSEMPLLTVAAALLLSAISL